jgi:hypothetical protein
MQVHITTTQRDTAKKKQPIHCACKLIQKHNVPFMEFNREKENKSQTRLGPRLTLFAVGLMKLFCPLCHLLSINSFFCFSVYSFRT